MARSKVTIAIAFCSALGFASALAEAQKIYWTSNGIGDHKIMRSDLDGSNIEEFLTQVGPIALTVDPVNGKLYWTGSNDVTFFLGIHRINLDATNAEDLVSRKSGQTQFGLALDVTGGKMYWTEAVFESLGEIQRANLDGSNVEVLLTGLDDPWGIALDPGAGKMYWTERGAQRIRRADLDGTSIQELVTGLDGPRGIALDLPGGKMYWGDAQGFGDGSIMRSALDGSNVEVLFAADGGTDSPGVALDLDARKIYVSDFVDIVRSNLDGSNLVTLVQLFAPAFPGIALDLREPIPAASDWGLVLLALTLLTAATIILLRRPTPHRV